MKIIEIKKKIPKFLIILLVVLLILSIYSGLNKFEENSTLNELAEHMRFNATANDLIHELQIERGLSSGFLASCDEFFSLELKEQRKTTDEQIKFFNQGLLDPERNILNNINKSRENIDLLSTVDFVDTYTNNINTLIKRINQISSLSYNGELTALVDSYLILIDIKEKSGLERAIMVKVFGEGTLSDEDFYKFGELVSAQDVYIEHFMHTTKQKYVDMFASKVVEQSCDKVKEDRNILYSKSKKNNILLDIQEIIGYAGLIHNFKNYVLRGEEKYADDVKKQYSELLTAINTYKEFNETSTEEVKELNIIVGVFSKYMRGIDIARSAHKNGLSARALDKLVKVNDEPAKKAFHNLKTNIYGSQNNWFEHSSNRINRLQDMENQIALDIMSFIDTRKVTLFSELLVHIVILIIILIIIISSIIVLRQLLESSEMLNRAQENTKSGSFEYYINDNIIFWSDEHYKLLQVNKECFKPTYDSYMSFVHPDDVVIVEKNLSLSKYSKKVIFFEYRMIRPDKTIMYVRSSMEVVKYSVNGEPLIMVGTITDISEFKQLEQEIIDTQKDVIFTMGAIGESRSRETGEHVKRVATYSKLLYLLYGASEEDAELLKMASPMHDIGKVGIPDSILNKRGELTPGEWAIMQMHSEMGYEMLKESNRKILKLAATVALTHHEHYDGNGYPKGLVADEIPVVGRITALAGVFDALGNDRCYKDAWKFEDIVSFIKEQKGKQFDPKLVDIFIDNLDEFVEIRDLYQDER